MNLGHGRDHDHLSVHPVLLYRLCPRDQHVGDLREPNVLLALLVEFAVRP